MEVKKRRVGVKQSIRVRILARDGGVCRKCGRKEHLTIHHIQAVQDGGGDEDENLITLCFACHREWEVAEMVMNIPFDEWLSVPPYSLLFTAFRLQDQMGGLSVNYFHRTVLEAHQRTHALRTAYGLGEEIVARAGKEQNA